MTRPSITWGHITKFLRKHDEFQIYHEGGDALLTKQVSGGAERGKLVVRIGHQFQHRTKKISPGLLCKIELLSYCLNAVNFIGSPPPAKVR